uniref:Uncharacterized protein n=1 Tax=Oncorhynchus tshawytscha TaxID=74940 RepID=A0A8C8HMI6_ONCTS
MIIFIIVSRDIVLKHLSVSLDPRSWQSCADSGQLSFEGIRRFKEESVICFLIIIIFSSKNQKLFPIVEAMQKHFSDTIFFLFVAMHHIMSTGKGCLSYKDKYECVTFS